MSIGSFSGIFIVLFGTSLFWFQNVEFCICPKIILQLHANPSVKAQFYLSNNIGFVHHQRIKLTNEVLQLIDRHSSCPALSPVSVFV